MNRLKSILLLALLLALLGLAGALIVATNRLSKALQQITASAASVSSDVHGLRTELTKKGGTIDIADHVLLHVDRITGEAAIASRQQRTELKQINQRALALFDSADATLRQINTAVGHSSSDLHSISVALANDLDSLNPVLAETKNAIADLDKNLLNDPDIKIILAELASTLKNADGVTSDTHRVSTDIANRLHKYLNDKPTLKSRIITALNVAYHLALLKLAITK